MLPTGPLRMLRACTLVSSHPCSSSMIPSFICSHQFHSHSGIGTWQTCRVRTFTDYRSFLLCALLLSPCPPHSSRLPPPASRLPPPASRLPPPASRLPLFHTLLGAPFCLATLSYPPQFSLVMPSTRPGYYFAPTTAISPFFRTPLMSSRIPSSCICQPPSPPLRLTRLRYATCKSCHHTSSNPVLAARFSPLLRTPHNLHIKYSLHRINHLFSHHEACPVAAAC